MEASRSPFNPNRPFMDLTSRVPAVQTIVNMRYYRHKKKIRYLSVSKTKILSIFAAFTLYYITYNYAYSVYNQRMPFILKKTRITYVSYIFPI